MSSSDVTAVPAKTPKFDYRDFWTIRDNKDDYDSNDATTAADRRQETEEDPSSPSREGDNKSQDDEMMMTTKTVTGSRSINSKFDRIVLLGERHSGTSYTTRKLEECFPDLDVSDFLVRFKHWFQPSPEYVVDITNKFLRDDSKGRPNAHTEEEDMHKIVDEWTKLASLGNPRSAFNRTLVIAMFRSPYQWLEAMRLGPHHWTNHFTLYRFKKAPVQNTTGNRWYGSNFLSWQDFLTANMTIGNANYNASHLCQNAYSFGSISPCRGQSLRKELYPETVKKDYAHNISAAPDKLPFNADNTIYEMDEQTGLPFDNPLALRAAKMRNFLDIPKVWDVGGFMTLQHEDINSKGSGFLLEQVGNIVGMKPACEADPPKNQGLKELDGNWTNWISDHVDWELENRVGYVRLPPVIPQEAHQEPEMPESMVEVVKQTQPDVAESRRLPPVIPQEPHQEPEKPESAAEVVKQTQPDDAASRAPDQIDKPKSFDRIVLLGERHSGTSYTTSMLAKCYPSLDVSDFLIRFKHWFQPTPEYVVDVSKRFLQNNTVQSPEDMHKIARHWPEIASLENPKSAFNRTLVIVMARNVFDWLEAMRLGPHHWLNHYTMYRFADAPVSFPGNKWYGSHYLPWKAFLAANMTLDNDVGGYNETHLCQSAYLFGSVTPCRASRDLYPDSVKKDYKADINEAPDSLPFNGHRPIYEMDEHGKPFENPLAMRTAKIRNFMDIPNKWDVGGFMTLQHEDVNNKGTKFLLEQVSNITGIPPSCEPDAPMHMASKELSSDWAQWIAENADWRVEGLLGYKRPAQSTQESSNTLTSNLS